MKRTLLLYWIIDMKGLSGLSAQQKRVIISFSSVSAIYNQKGQLGIVTLMNVMIHCCHKYLCTKIMEHFMCVVILIVAWEMHQILLKG